jgi:hypothetical protein
VTQGVSHAEGPGSRLTDGRSGALLGFSLTTLLALYLLATSRWGSYLAPPGVPVYVGDVVAMVALAQSALAVRTRRVRLDQARALPLAVLAALTLATWAAIRLAIDLPLRPDAPRDFAPYAYAIVCWSAFAVPPRSERRWLPYVYAILVAHAMWVLVPPRLPGFPWALPNLGNDVILLVTRPDVDAAVCGITAAFALSRLVESRTKGRWHKAGLVTLVAAGLFGATSQQSRAGLLASLVCIVSVLAVAVRKRSSTVRESRHARLGARLSVLVVLALFAGFVIALSPTGSRLIEGLSPEPSQASGTVAVRQEVWSKVTRFVLRDAERTGIGVGFGRNFIDESGTRTALEGNVFTNVRSPHNYLVGTFARLGLFGALIAAVMVLAGWSLAAKSLSSDIGPVTTLAALVAIAVPITALLGVVLESPFGALPYFWSLGQLAAAQMKKSRAPLLRETSAEPADPRGEFVATDTSPA